ISTKDKLSAAFFEVPSDFEEITPEQYEARNSTAPQSDSAAMYLEEDLSEGMIAYFDRETSLYGLKSETGEIVSEPKFSTMGSFLDGHAIAYNLDYLAGLIDKKGQNIIPFEYSYLTY